MPACQFFDLNHEVNESSRRSYSGRFSIMLNCTILLLALLILAGSEVSAQDKRAEIPSAKESEAAQKLVREIYQDRYKAATTREKKTELADSILRAGIDTKDDVIGRFVLWALARNIAIHSKFPLINSA